MTYIIEAQATREPYYKIGDKLECTGRSQYKDYEVLNITTGKRFYSTHIPDGMWSYIK